jgi:hypothetical protein
LGTLRGRRLPMPMVLKHGSKGKRTSMASSPRLNASPVEPIPNVFYLFSFSFFTFLLLSMKWEMVLSESFHQRIGWKRMRREKKYTNMWGAKGK